MTSPTAKKICVQIETINFCNHRCAYCFLGHVRMPRPKAMPLKLFEKILRELTTLDRPIDLVAFSAYGEPTIDPHFIERLELLKQYGFSYWNITNGTNLSPVILNYFYNNMPLIRNYFLINFPAMNVEHYKKLTDENAEQLHTVIRNLESLGENIKKYAISAKITVLGWNDLAHQRNYEEVKRHFEPYGFTVMKSELNDRAGLLRPFVDNNAFVPHPQLCTNGNRFDDFLHFGLNGNLYVCCHDFRQKYSFGNIKYHSLRAILSSPRRQEMIARVKKDLCCYCISAQ